MNEWKKYLWCIVGVGSGTFFNLYFSDISEASFGLVGAAITALVMITTVPLFRKEK